MAEDEQTIDDFQQYLQKKVDLELKNEDETKNDVEEKKNEKNGKKEEENKESEQEEDEEENFESVDESESDISGYEEDEEDEDDKALMDLLLKQILACHKKKKNRDLDKKSSFISSLKTFLNLNMETRAKKINEKHVHDFIFLRGSSTKIFTLTSKFSNFQKQSRYVLSTFLYRLRNVSVRKEY